MKNTMHYQFERQERENVIRNIGGDGLPLMEIHENRNPEKGGERVVLTDNAIILYFGAQNGRLITKKIARPGQIRRLFPSAPESVIRKAMAHQALGLNCA